MPTPWDDGTGEERDLIPGDPTAERRALRARALDWLLGAFGLLVVLLLVAGVFWLSVTRPIEEGGATPTPAPTTAEPTSGPTGDPKPPPDLTEEQVWFGNVELDSESLVAAGTPLLDVVGSGRDVTSGQDGVAAGWVRLTGTVPFHVIATELGPETAVGPAGGDEVQVVRTLELLGRGVDVLATGTVDVVDGRLVVEPTTVEIEGGGFLSSVLTGLAKRFVRIEHDIEGLPEGLVLQHVEIVDDGFRAILEGSDVILTQPR